MTPPPAFSPAACAGLFFDPLEDGQELLAVGRALAGRHLERITSLAGRGVGPCLRSVFDPHWRGRSRSATGHRRLSWGWMQRRSRRACTRASSSTWSLSSRTAAGRVVAGPGDLSVAEPLGGGLDFPPIQLRRAERRKAVFDQLAGEVWRGVVVPDAVVEAAVEGTVEHRPRGSWPR